MSRRRQERNRTIKDSMEYIFPHSADFRNILGFAALKGKVISNEDIGSLKAFFEKLRRMREDGLSEEIQKTELMIKELLAKYGISMAGVPRHFWKPIFEAAEKKGVEFTRKDHDNILRLCEVLEDVVAVENPNPEAYSLTIEELNAVLEKYNLVYT